ncbi:hypothetical protein AHAS_Ahas04G0059300 [Arachis hypogaea]
MKIQDISNSEDKSLSRNKLSSQNLCTYIEEHQAEMLKQHRELSMFVRRTIENKEEARIRSKSKELTEIQHRTFDNVGEMQEYQTKSKDATLNDFNDLQSPPRVRTREHPKNRLRSNMEKNIANESKKKKNAALSEVLKLRDFVILIVLEYSSGGYSLDCVLVDMEFNWAVWNEIQVIKLEELMFGSLELVKGELYVICRPSRPDRPIRLISEPGPGLLMPGQVRPNTGQAAAPSRPPGLFPPLVAKFEF